MVKGQQVMSAWPGGVTATYHRRETIVIDTGEVIFSYPCCLPAGSSGRGWRGRSGCRGAVLELMKELRRQGMPVILISHNMPHVFGVADRVHIQRLGRGAGVVSPASTTMEDAVTIMTGAKQLEPQAP